MDFMCFWCWGFVLVVEVLFWQVVVDGVVFYLVVGGLCVGYGVVFDLNICGYIFGYWQIVQQIIGQLFCFDDVLFEGFVYDIELVCWVLVVVCSFDEESVWLLVRVIQWVFYVEGCDVIQVVVFVGLVEVVGFLCIEFVVVFDSGEVCDVIVVDFVWVQDFGIVGFLILLVECNG